MVVVAVTGLCALRQWEWGLQVIGTCTTVSNNAFHAWSTETCMWCVQIIYEYPTTNWTSSVRFSKWSLESVYFMSSIKLLLFWNQKLTIVSKSVHDNKKLKLNWKKFREKEHKYLVLHFFWNVKFFQKLDFNTTPYCVSSAF
jgi:hypothetical protein